MTTYKVEVSDLFSEPLEGYPAQDFRSGEPMVRHVLWIEWRGNRHYVIALDLAQAVELQHIMEYEAGMPCWIEEVEM
jgi:hypothetical protein